MKRDEAVKNHPGIFKDTVTGMYGYVVDVASVGPRSQQKRRGFRTIKIAEAERAKVLTETAQGTFVRASRATVERYLLDEWMPAKQPTLKPSTAATYEQMTRAYVVPRIGAVELGRVDGAMLNALYGELLANGRTGASGKRGGLSPKTVRNVHGMMHRAFKDAVRWRRLSVNPADAADQPKMATPEMKAWTSEDLGRFIQATSADRLAGAWRLLATTGMRRGELLGLRWSDVDLAAKRLRIVQTMTMTGDRPEVGTPKTRAGQRRVSLDEATLVGLKRWRKGQAEERLMMGAGWQGDHDLVVTEPDGTPVHPQVLTRRFQAITKQAGLPVIRLHDVRHSYATAALGAGVRVEVLSKRLGHADVGVTLRVYAHVLPGDDEDAANLVAGVLTS